MPDFVKCNLSIKRKTILARLRRKIDIIRLDQKQRGGDLGGHASECLKLLDILDRMEGEDQ